jgi:hypothetical protein
LATLLTGQALSVVLPDGWDGRIYLNDYDLTDVDFPNPVMHISTFSLPLRDGVGDYGMGAIELMGPTDAFIALVEFNQNLATEALFQVNTGMPRPIDSEVLAGHQMQAPISGFGGVQFFFNEPNPTTGQLGRAFSLYVVVGDITQAAATALRFNPVLATVVIRPRAGVYPA